MRALVIVNPAAGRGAARTELNEGLGELRRQGWELEVVRTRSQGHATALAGRGADEGYEAVLVAGGDGTIGETVNGLVGRGVPLGVLPVGTGNVWAIEAGLPGGLLALPGQVVRAARDLTRATVRQVDVGHLQWEGGERHFLLWAGVGFDARVISRAEPDLKRRWGAFSYVLATLRTATDFTSAPTRMVIDGQRFQTETLLVVIANARHYAGLKLIPQARLDDGLLDVTIFTGRHAADMLAPILGRIIQVPLDGATASTYAAAEGEIAPLSPQPVHADGELVGETPLRFRVVPRSLAVLHAG